MKLTIKNQIATILIDQTDQKVNTLNSKSMEDLKHIIHEIKEKTLLALIIRSGKKDVFIAGADIQELKEIKSEAEGLEKSKLGQGIFNELEQLKFPTIAAIDGAALGGGLELALACQFRVVSDNPKTQLGLPEVNLGIIPGWGGTQRLPKLIGLTKGLPLILSGKMVDSKKALRLGLADALYPQELFDEKVEDFIENLHSNKKRKIKKPFLEKMPLGSFVITTMAKKMIKSKTKGFYPAPLAALRSIRYGYHQSLKKGLKKEAYEFSKLSVHQITENLTDLFLYKGVQIKEKSKKINHSAVLGAGLMGGGIAWLLSYRVGLTRIKDINWNALSKAYQTAEKIYGQLRKIKKLKQHERTLFVNKISGTTSYEGFKKMDIVVEAIVEDMALKKKVYQELEAQLRDDAIIASNTSSLSITELSEGLKHPERFIGMHFFSPVNRMPLIKVIPGKHTSQETISTIVSLSKKLKKTPILVKNCPGFFVNRVLMPYINEAILLVQEGVSIKQVDYLMTQFGLPIGPLALMDEVGLDVGYKVAQILVEGFPTRMSICSLMDQVYKDNLLGKKSGEGFYIYNGKNKKPNQEKLNSSPNSDFLNQDINDRLILLMLNEIAYCLEEGIVSCAADADMAMILGVGFPPFRGGLCKYADQTGIKSIFNRLKELSHLYGDRFKPAPIFEKLNQNNHTFYTHFNLKIEEKIHG